MSATTDKRLVAFREAEAAYYKAERAYERASVRDRPAARKTLDDARQACYAALRGES